VPPALAAAPSIAVISARRSDSTSPTTVRWTIGERALPPLTLDGSWSEQRFELPTGALTAGKTAVKLELESTAEGNPVRIDLDHVLLLPTPAGALSSP
jgi:hypothetical protein